MDFIQQVRKWLQIVTWRSRPHALINHVLIGNEDLISSTQNGSFVWHIKHIRYQILQTAEEPQEEHWWGRSTSSSFAHCQHWWQHSLSPYQGYTPSSLLCSSHLPPTDHQGLKFVLKKLKPCACFCWWSLLLWEVGWRGSVKTLDSSVFLFKCLRATGGGSVAKCVPERSGPDGPFAFA